MGIEMSFAEAMGSLVKAMLPRFEAVLPLVKLCYPL